MDQILDNQSKKGKDKKPSAVELAILNGIEAYERGSNKRMQNDKMRSKEALY